MAAPRPRDPEREGVLVYDDAHVVVIDKPDRRLERAVRGARDRHRDGPHPRRVAAAWASAATSVPLHVVHRIDKRDLGPARVRQDQARRGRRSRRSCARTRWSARTCASRTAGRGAAHRVARSSPIAATACAARRATRDQGKRAVTHVTRRASAARRDAVRGAARDRQDPPDPHPPRRVRPSARRRDGLHPRLHAARRSTSPRLHAARRDARLRASGHRRDRVAARRRCRPTSPRSSTGSPGRREDVQRAVALAAK